MFLKRDTTTEQDKTDYQAGIVKLSNSNGADSNHIYNNTSLLPFIDKNILTQNLNYIKTLWITNHLKLF